MRASNPKTNSLPQHAWLVQAYGVVLPSSLVDWPNRHREPLSLLFLNGHNPLDVPSSLSWFLSLDVTTIYTQRLATIQSPQHPRFSPTHF